MPAGEMRDPASRTEPSTPPASHACGERGARTHASTPRGASRTPRTQARHASHTGGVGAGIRNGAPPFFVSKKSRPPYGCYLLRGGVDWAGDGRGGALASLPPPRPRVRARPLGGAGFARGKSTHVAACHPALTTAAGPPAPQAQAKKKRRLQRNRQSAQLHRDRKKVSRAVRGGCSVRGRR